MKTTTLFVTTIFLMGSLFHASGKTISLDANYPTNIGNEQPISFIERGVEFFVFTDGQFDFNTVELASENVYYRSGTRNTVNYTYGSPASQGVRIDHDAQGRVRRVGNTFINYDAHNRVKRIGSVYMNYNRFALSQVGGLRIFYNRFGQIAGVRGSVKNQASYYGSYTQSPGYQQYGNSNIYYRQNVKK